MAYTAEQKRLAATLADKYISRDGGPTPKPKRVLNIRAEKIVLEALREIARGNGNRRPLTGKQSQNIALRTLADIMQPFVG